MPGQNTPADESNPFYREWAGLPPLPAMDRDNLGRELESGTGTEGSSPVGGESEDKEQVRACDGKISVDHNCLEWPVDSPIHENAVQLWIDANRHLNKRWITLEDFLKHFKPRPVEEVRGELFNKLFRNLDNPVPWDHHCPELKRNTTAVSDFCEYCGVERPQARTDPEH